jgi:hypothetical protein
VLATSTKTNSKLKYQDITIIIDGTVTLMKQLKEIKCPNKSAGVLCIAKRRCDFKNPRKKKSQEMNQKLKVRVELESYNNILM